MSRAAGWRAGCRWAGFALGLGLLAAALAVVWQRRETVVEALGSVGHVAPGPLALLLAAVVANVVLSGLFLRTLILRYGRVGAVEMQALVAAATLVNFLPLRPGLFGRVAYHKTVNGIAVGDTARTIVQAVLITTAIAAYLAATVVLARASGGTLWLGVLAPLPLLAAASALSRPGPWARAVLLRYLEVLVWGVRYHAAFTLIGAPIDATAALALACASVVASMVPFVGNGLGLREWAIGLLAPLLTAYRLELGVTADLVNRAAELPVIAALGVAGIAWLVRRGATTRSSPRSPDPPP